MDEKVYLKNTKKATEKHKNLANFIKETHNQLYNEAKAFGAEEAWKIHLSKNEILKVHTNNNFLFYKYLKKLKICIRKYIKYIFVFKNYAESMYQLATEHWSKKSKISEQTTFCRVEWIKNKCKEYFFNEGMKKYDEKEVCLLKKNIQNFNDVKNIQTCIETKVKILDVGSCYNPFATEKNVFSVTAIDIAPYTDDVLKCDFLNLQIGSEKKYIDKNRELIELPEESFDVVIFSLLLEYIPCPEKRFLCCKKAYDLLKQGGILFIATPDSKHQGSNAKIINTSWKIVLAKLGFMRICYEKLPHVHCMMFRKCFYNEAAMYKINWKKLKENDELYSTKKIFIPKDFQVTKLVVDDNQERQFDSEELITLFNELPKI